MWFGLAFCWLLLKLGVLMLVWLCLDVVVSCELEFCFGRVVIVLCLRCLVLV